MSYEVTCELSAEDVELIVLEYLRSLLPSFEGSDDRVLKKDYKALKRVIKVVEA